MNRHWVATPLLLAGALWLAACGSTAAPAAGTPASSHGQAAAPAGQAAGGRPGGAPGSGPGRHGGPGGFFDLNAAAQYLGISGTQLHQNLRGGKSLAQVAQAQSKSPAGLEQSLVAAAKVSLAQAVAAKRITSAQEQQDLASLSQRIDGLVTRTPGQFPGRRARPGGASTAASGGSST